MSKTPLQTLRALRRATREEAEARFSAALAALRASEEQAARCAQRQASHLAGRLAIAASRLSTLEGPAVGGRARPGLDSPLCRAQRHEARERLLRTEEALLEFGRQRAARRLAESMGRVSEGRAELTLAELRLQVVERSLAERSEAERTRLRRREEREGDDYSSSRNSSL